MTRDEAIEIIECGDISNRWGKDGEEVEKMAIKALEQENILDKIREEIHATAEMHEDGDYYLRDEWIDEIIDKYKAESEVQE